jgi:hypothetical protein
LNTRSPGLDGAFQRYGRFGLGGCGGHFTAVDAQAGDGGAGAAADLDPEFDGVADRQGFVELDDRRFPAAVILEDTADAHAAVVGATVAHHFPPLFAEEVGGGEAAVEILRHVFLVLGRYGELGAGGHGGIDGAAVAVDNDGDVFGPFMRLRF